MCVKIKVVAVKLNNLTFIRDKRKRKIIKFLYKDIIKTFYVKTFRSCLKSQASRRLVPYYALLLLHRPFLENCSKPGGNKQPGRSRKHPGSVATHCFSLTSWLPGSLVLELATQSCTFWLFTFQETISILLNKNRSMLTSNYGFKPNIS